MADNEGKMLAINCLPLSVTLSIFSHLSINDIHQCRLVNKSFKAMVEEVLKYPSTITHLELVLSGKEHFSQKYRLHVLDRVPDSYISDTYLSKPLVEGQLKSTYGFSDPSFFYFLEQFCPHLQVIYMRDIRVNYKDLTRVANNLRFFWCQRLILSPKEQEMGPVSLLKPFKYLEEFRETSTNQHTTKFFSTHLPRQVKCLELNRRPIEVDPNIVELHIHDFPLAQRLTDSLLTNLSHLSIHKQVSPSETRFNATLLPAPNLRSFSYEGRIDSVTLTGLLNYVHSLETLLTLQLKTDQAANPIRPEIKMSLSKLPNLRKLIINNYWVTFVDKESESLRYLITSHMLTMDFVFPNLELFINEMFPVDPDPQKLLVSLSKCARLSVLELRFFEDGTIVFFQDLFFVLSTLKQLEHLQLYDDQPFRETPHPIRMVQMNFPSLKYFKLRLPYEIQLHPADSLRSVFFDAQVDLTHKNFSIFLDPQCVKLVMDMPMHNLTDIRCSFGEKGDWRTGKLPVINLKSMVDQFERFVQFSSKLQLFSYTGPVSQSAIIKMFTHFESITSLREVVLDSILIEQSGGKAKMLVPSLPPFMKKLTLLVNAVLDFSVVHPQVWANLDHLQIGDAVNISLDYTELVNFRMQTKFCPPDSTLPVQLRESKMLRTISFEFLNSTTPEACFIQSLLDTASQLPYLSRLELKGDKKDQVTECVDIRQSDMPSVKKFSWSLPMNAVFYPIDSFYKLNVEKDTIEFLSHEGQGFHFDIHGDADVFVQLECEMTLLTNFVFDVTETEVPKASHEVLATQLQKYIK